MRRMVVVLCEEKPAKSAASATYARPEKKFAASLAGGQTFEPEVVVDAEVTESIKENLIALSSSNM